ncbi:uncharacterized protein LOC117296988 [Asterias rubens]|uniref:uncharacterized protein LOC117296988 n=1 Tax=Asterias rubens TaxID=7604 RepID=UPI0014554F82|nr:uncharacterized protein LOC117296988 [Asterias rubens]
MDSIVFMSTLLVTSVTRTTTLTIEVASDRVTVREGEPLNLLCSFTLDGQGIQEVRWYRGSIQQPYGSIDVSSCGVSPLLCPMVNTTDNRGVVQFTRGLRMQATFILLIDHSLVRDNTMFSCGVQKMLGGFQSSAKLIRVTVQHLPDPSYPMCLRSNSSTLTDILSLSCWAEITQPVVSLEWTVEGNSSDQLSFTSSSTETDEDRVENTLFFNETGIPSGSLVFTCHMTSYAFPHIQRNCSIGPIPVPGKQTTAGILSSPEQTTAPQSPDQITASTVPEPSKTATPRNDPKLNTAVIASIASASVAIIVILLVIIAFLVSTRREKSAAKPQNLGIRLSLTNTSPRSNTSLYANQSDPIYANQNNTAISSSNQRPVTLEPRPGDATADSPPVLYAEVPSDNKVSYVQSAEGYSYAVVSNEDGCRESTALEDQPNMGQQSPDPLEYYTLEPGDRQMTHGRGPKTIDDQYVYAEAAKGQGLTSLRSSQLDNEDAKMVHNILYVSTNE